MAGVRYQGLSPGTRRLRWLLLSTLVVVVLAGTGGQALDGVTGWLRDEYDRLPWYATRVTALLAYLALTASVVYGLLLSTKILDAIAHRAVSFTLHQDLASVGLALALVHAAVLMIDRSVPFDPAEVVIPFSSPYRPLWVGLGQLALIASSAVLFSFYVRKRIGQGAWRRLHHLSFLAFAGATAHGLMAGSDTQAAWVFWGYVTMTATVVFLVAYRISLSVASRVTATDAARPSTSGTLGGRDS